MRSGTSVDLVQNPSFTDDSDFVFSPFYSVHCVQFSNVKFSTYTFRPSGSFPPNRAEIICAVKVHSTFLNPEATNITVNDPFISKLFPSDFLVNVPSFRKKISDFSVWCFDIDSIDSWKTCGLQEKTVTVCV